MLKSAAHVAEANSSSRANSTDSCCAAHGLGSSLIRMLTSPWTCALGPLLALSGLVQVLFLCPPTNAVSAGGASSAAKGPTSAAAVPAPAPLTPAAQALLLRHPELLLQDKRTIEDKLVGLQVRVR
eukprot:scaffold263772_cov19-Tisochrysis_lutea.AAC.1